MRPDSVIVVHRVLADITLDMPAFCKVVVASAVFFMPLFQCRLFLLWVECDGTDGMLISRAAQSAMRVLMAGLYVQRMTFRQHLLILFAMTLRRGDETDTTVAMLVVVPADEVAHPTAGGIHICKAILGPLRAAFQGSKQRL